MSSSSSSLLLLLLHLCCFIAIPMSTTAQLRPDYYYETCPKAESIVRDEMKKAMIKETRNAASILRFQFHDCFVNGCDGSVLLDDTPTMLGEKLAENNADSLRSFEVVDQIKEALEEACPGIVSCADIVIMGARDAVSLSGGPSWKVKLGRKDSLTASLEDANQILPSPTENATFLIDVFSKLNLSTKDMVALLGSHTIGKGRCFSVVYRLYNLSGIGIPDTIEPTYREKVEKLCPLGGDESVTENLDSTPELFDNQYFKDLVSGRGFLYSDETLFASSETRSLVQLYARDQEQFFKDFVEAMLKMADLQSGRAGEVRKNCRVVNGGPEIEFLKTAHKKTYLY